MTNHNPEYISEGCRSPHKNWSQRCTKDIIVLLKERLAEEEVQRQKQQMAIRERALAGRTFRGQP